MNAVARKKIKDFNVFALKSEEVIRKFIEPANDFPEFPESEIRQSIVARFNKQVELYPNRIAVSVEKQELTYEELNRLSNRIGRTLCSNFGESRGSVALLFEHDAEMVAGMLGVLKSGNFYIPLDPTYPPKRLSYILKDSDTGVLLTNDKNMDMAGRLIEDARTPVMVINIADIGTNVPGDNLHVDIKPDSLAYILYTSGSTGFPKGVLQNHRNVLHFIRVYTNNLHIHPEDKLTLFSSYSFDAAVMDIYGAVLTGAALYPYDIKNTGNLNNMAAWLRDNRMTIFHSIPTVFRFFTDTLENMDRFEDIRLIVMGGEEVNKKDIERYKTYFPDDCLFINGLGPTESTVTLQYFIDKEMEISRGIVPVGFPVEHTRVLLIDENNKEVPIFGTGEIVYKSNHLVPGYANRPEKTHEVFGPDPVTGDGRVYRTGDFGRRLPDGSIEFVGRRDHQVKIRGYRVELGEIESMLDKVEGIKKSVVAAFKNNDGDNYLTAYYTSDRKGISEPDLVNKLKMELPPYMVPELFFYLEELPLTPSGKINRKALPGPDLSRITANTVYVEPGDETEKKLLEIWKNVLNLEKISVDSNYFVLGGHSLNILKLISYIQKEFDIVLPLGEIVKYPTIQQLAARIEDRDEDPLDAVVAKLDCIERLNHGYSEKNIFIVHAMNGMVYQYKELAELLEKDYNVFGIQARGLDGATALSETPQSMVDDYLAQVLALQKGGPYVIAGYCSGNIIAYEIARRLEAMNFEVEKLILFDTFAFFTDRLVRNLGWLERLPRFFKKMLSSANRKRFKKAKENFDAGNETPGINESCAATVPPEEKVKNHIRFLSRFILPLGLINASILTPLAEESDYPRATVNDFAKMTHGKVDVIRTPGDHNSIFEKPCVRDLVNVLTEHLTPRRNKKIEEY